MESPIVFAARGLELDTRLTVFSRVFHVHSAKLKEYSAFFYKFLDPSNKGGCMRVPTGPFRYDWVSVYDSDGVWGMESITNESNSISAPAEYNPAEVKKFETAFEKLLYSFYNKSFQLASCDELQTITDLADYYCALPQLSRAMSEVLRCSPGLIAEIQPRAADFLLLATKLRHQDLFHDSLIYVLGPWHKPAFRDLSEPRLKALTHAIYSRMSIELLELQADILLYLRFTHPECSSDSPRALKTLGIVVRDAITTVSQPDQVDTKIFSWPQYIQEIKTWYQYNDYKSDVQTRSGLLLKDNRVLGGYDGAANKDTLKEYFLSVDLGDEQLPWDVTKEDW